ncbi:Cof-type HAD-IIB family hydrolase [Microbacterium sp. P02]|uniref:Cof-type HAD-IIB family hydrolase n=1 Tax=Microbacterium sp. P02 TaxID=3366260 RepID=UPI003671B7E4
MTPRPDIRLIAADMDGTLLDGDGEVPDTLWPLLERLSAAGVEFVPASGRQLATLRRTFGAASDRMSFIAENGTFVVRGHEEVSVDAMDPVFVDALVRRLRELALGGLDIGVVVCGKESAYIERADAAFLGEAEKYYARLTVVDDLLAPDDAILKIAIYDFGSAEERTAPALADLAESHQVVVSGHHWIDVMELGVNKGVALQTLQRALGVTRSQTAAFGDYLNDLELLDAAEWSFAMENAHEQVAARAAHRAPSNLEHGVITTIERLVFGGDGARVKS